MLTLYEHDFQGPIYDPGDLPESDGVYVVATIGADGGVVLIDCGESKNIQERIASHDRKGCWLEHAGGLELAYYHYVTDARTGSAFRRKVIEQLIRKSHDFPCGKE